MDEARNREHREKSAAGRVGAQTMKLRLPAGPHELFSRDAADNMAGQTFQIGSSASEGKVLEAEVTEYGRAIELTIEWSRDD